MSKNKKIMIPPLIIFAFLLLTPSLVFAKLGDFCNKDADCTDSPYTVCQSNACAQPQSNGTPGSFCTQNSDCTTAGSTCQNNACSFPQSTGAPGAFCMKDSDCTASGSKCVSNACTQPTSPAPAPAAPAAPAPTPTVQPSPGGQTTAPIQPLINPIGGTAASPAGVTNISTLIGQVIKAVLGIVGSIALLMFIYGGFLWLTSSGNEQRITQGKQVLVWATIGLAVIFLSYTLVNFVIKGLTTGGGQ